MFLINNERNASYPRRYIADRMYRPTCYSLRLVIHVLASAHHMFIVGERARRWRYSPEPHTHNRKACDAVGLQDLARPPSKQASQSCQCWGTAGVAW